jgi:low temperature requirement protein LtrA
MDAEIEEPDKRVEPLELFFDLVFVFAITQVTTRLSGEPTWAGLLRGLLVLAAIWWAWAAYAWLTNEVDPDRPGVRVAVFASMSAMLVASLAIPRAFERDAFAFAAAYLVVRALHIALFVQGSDNLDVRQAARLLAPTAITAPGLLLVASLLPGDARVSIWAVALGIDYIGGALRGIDGWKLSPGHFAERHSLIILIALGESIVEIGVGAANDAFSLGLLAATVLGVATAAALWWTYFDGTAAEIEERLVSASGRERNVVARDSFSFLHLPLVAGIVLLALGIKATVGDVASPLDTIPAVALCAGVCLYLTALVAVRQRLLGNTDHPRLLAALACLAWLPGALTLPALAALAGIAAITIALVAHEQTGRPGDVRLGRTGGSS